MLNTLPARTLGRSGIATAALGLGCWAIGGPTTNLGMPIGWSNADDDASMAGLRLAHQRGIGVFDTADVYGHGRSERLIGQLVREVDRDSVVLVSKVGYFTPDERHRFDPINIRRQLQTTLSNLSTDHLDIYFLHNESFGDDDAYLEPAITTLRALRDEGLVRAVGMRGPHRFAVDRLHGTGDRRGDKIARFRYLFDLINPDVIAVRDNLLTPAARSQGIFALADTHGCGVLVNKPLSQGLLTGTYRPDHPRVFGAGDHRARKRWFGPQAAAILHDGITELRDIVGDDPVDLIAVALWACLQRSDNAVVLAGFTRPEQVAMNAEALARRPAAEAIVMARAVMAQVQQRLDSLGEVFTDEPVHRDRPVPA
jgi:methylglyoxal reductase